MDLKSLRHARLINGIVAAVVAVLPLATEAAKPVVIDASSATKAAQLQTVQPADYWQAINAGSLPYVKKYAADVDINATDALSQPALLIVAGRGYVEVAAWLLAQGANIEIRGPRNWTPLIAATFSGQIDMVNLLLQHHADTHAQSADGLNALLYAIDLHYDNIVATLIAAGADVNVSTAAQIHNGHSALMRAALRNDAVAADRLLKAGARLEQQDTQGRTPLFYAAENNAVAVLPLLLQWHVDIKQRDRAGNNALHMVAVKGQLDTAQWLLDNGVELNGKNGAGDTALDIAAREGNTDVAHLLALQSNQAAQNNALFAALQGGSLPTVEALLELGLDVNMQNEQGVTPLMYAAQYRHPHLIEFLLQNKADVNAIDQLGNSALLYALLNSSVHAGIVRDLLNAGASKIQRNKRGQSATTLLAASSDIALKNLLKESAQ